MFRLGIFVPYAVPGVVATLMWGYLYGPDFGPFAQLAEKLGTAAPSFLSATGCSGSLANIVTWEFTGYNMIILYAALRAIPHELYEAAAVDGAGAWRIAWSIKIPALRPGAAALPDLLGDRQLPAVQRAEAAATARAERHRQRLHANLYAYSLAFTSQEVNYAAAVSFLLGLVIVVVSYTVLLAANRRSRA